MASREELERLDKLMLRQERRIRDAFLAFVVSGKSDSQIDRVVELLEQGRIDEVVRFMDSFVPSFADSIIVSSSVVGAAEATSLGVTFDPGNARAAEIAQAQRLNLIRHTTESQRDSVRQALIRGQEEGLGPRRLALMFRDAVGLTPAQEAAVLNYRRLLEEGNSDALRRDIRDRRYDRSVARAIRDDEPLSGAQIDKMVERYRSRYIQFRAEAIGRTEGVRITNLARAEALRQAAEQLEIEESRIIRVWNPTLDARTRDWHTSMKGQKKGVGEPFIDGQGQELMFPGDPNAPANTTINCRCILTFEFL